MTGRVIVINGGSSSGKSTIIRALQDVLSDPWLTFGVDDFVDALPPRLTSGDGGIDIAADGTVGVGAVFMEQENLWMQGIGAMVRVGAKIIIDDVFLGGPHSQGRWRAALEGIDVLWVGIRCDPDVAEAREKGRGDRPVGMARQQAELVHRGVAYDLEVDSSVLTPAAAAEVIRARV
ncbi:chloramphenicol phosphotransferase CPT [Microlunatus speluncae]|uniref:chloramphenicol phosphotransferase CPT n=1 Tax=Microlunatus speluncae TaxID=2594267 RepID=UPI001583108B|nr:chloramphenicol phosphotransferase CPT [Microlunatus speluncae]